MPNLWGYFRLRKSDGLIMIRCEKCGRPAYYDPNRMILNNGRYTDKNGTEFVRPILFFCNCMICCEPRSFPEYIERIKQMPEKEAEKYKELGAKLFAEYNEEVRRKRIERNEEKAQGAAKTDCKAAE